ncbi:hypothetical protein BFL35_08735 [Clavibacter michiganensis]|uniref:Uncharacterized protein n=1 Tax=Clavibacter michiganensis TaxID=28447 RepID=A0A251Y666_9MICO|nr:hypothetical protein [Clavibacter michiganensis]OUE19755.1 hypothetical protein BFL34_01897 [Clavibacter michiganensis]OUE30715.1 hypothetical protein BFL35_08735 [Clavibacter michiganensis]
MPMHRRRSPTPARPSHALLAVAALALVTPALGGCTDATPAAPASEDVRSTRSGPRPTPTDPPAPQVVEEPTSSPTTETGPVEIASGIITRPFTGGREAGRITVTDTGRAHDLEVRLSGFDDVPESIDARLLTGPFTPIEGCLPDVFTEVAAFGAFPPGQGEGLTTSVPRGWGISLLQDGDAHVMLTVPSATFPEEGTCLYPVLAEGDVTWLAR